MRGDRIRRLIAAFSFSAMFALPREAARLLREDDALFEADTRALDRARRQSQPRRVPVRSADCPLPGCDTCEPWLPAWLEAPTVEPDFDNHVWPAARNTSQVVCWLRERWPDAWWDTDGATVANTADRLLQIRCRAALGEMLP